MPRLVVAMPAFNSESTIRKAVTSTLRAMPNDSELVVLDDKSTDRTVEELGKINDRRLRVIIASENSGKGSARRRLLEESDSEFVSAMDSDDITFPWRFSLQFRALQSADVVFSSVIRFGVAEPGCSHKIRSRALVIRPSKPVALLPDEFPAAMLFHCDAAQSSLLARRSAIVKAGGYYPSRFGEDYDLFLRIASSGARMLRLATPVIAYRASPGQDSRLASQPDALRSNSDLLNSYVNLFNSRVESVALGTEPRPRSEISKIMKLGLTEQLRFFRPLNRLHYKSFIRMNRLPPVAFFSVKE